MAKIAVHPLPNRDNYTKEQSLSETTRALYELGTDAVPDDVLKLLKTYDGFREVFSATLPSLEGNVLHTFDFKKSISEFSFLFWNIESLYLNKNYPDTIEYFIGESKAVKIFSAPASGTASAFQGLSTLLSMTPLKSKNLKITSICISTYSDLLSGVHKTQSFLGTSFYMTTSEEINSNKFSVFCPFAINSGAIFSVWGMR